MQQSDRTEFYEISSGLEDSTYVVNYWVRFEGLVEFFLYDFDGRRLWFTSAVRTEGEYMLKFRTLSLKPGNTYSYEFRYKNKKYPGKFYFPG